MKSMNLQARTQPSMAWNHRPGCTNDLAQRNSSRTDSRVEKKKRASIGTRLGWYSGGGDRRGRQRPRWGPNPMVEELLQARDGGMKMKRDGEDEGMEFS